MSSIIFSGEGQTLRRKRITKTRKRTWEILPRIGTGPDDRWTVIGTPHPAPGNPAAEYEDGQFASIKQATNAVARCIWLDDGTHEED